MTYESLYEYRRKITKLEEENSRLRDKNSHLEELLSDYQQFKELLQRLLTQ